MENGLTGIFTHAGQTPQPGSTLAGPPLFYPGQSSSGDPGFLVNGYTTYQLGPNLWMGLGINAPFGLSVRFQEPWAGRNYGGDTTLRSFNANPVIAYRINDWISVGVGAQLQYATVRQTTGVTPFPPTVATLDGKGWGFGATAGVTFTPWRNTTIGLWVALGDQSGHPRHAHWASRDSQHVRFGGVNGQPSRHRQPWYSPPLRRSLDGHGYGRVE